MTAKTEQPPALPPPAPPPVPPIDTSDEEALRRRGLAIVKSADELERLEHEILEARLSGAGEDFAEAYLYLIEPSEKNRFPKPVVGPTLDFKRQVVRYINASGRAKLNLIPEPPIITDVTLDGNRRVVRVLVCAIDELTGVRKWAVKEETRTGAHAATIALEKAEGKAYESHPAFNRKVVQQRIKAFLKSQGLNPADFIIAGGSAGAWADFFSRARKAGVPGERVRKAVREATGGVGLSQVATAGEAVAAAQAVDESVGGASAAAPAPSPASAPAPVAANTEPMKPAPTAAPGQGAQAEAEPARADEEIKRLRATALELFKKAGADQPAVLESIWGEIGGPPAFEKPAEGMGLILYKRLARVASLVSAGAPIVDAIKIARTIYPDPKQPKEDAPGGEEQHVRPRSVQEGLGV